MKYLCNHKYGGNTEVLGEDLGPVPLGPRQIPHDLGSRPDLVQRGQSLTTSARHGPINLGVNVVR
jgi:hypothetical protein